MSKCRNIPGHGPKWLAAAAVALAALLAAATSYASPDTPFSRITAWQMGKLGGTPFSTHPIRKKGEQFFLERHLKEGELFAGVVKSYCEIAGISAEECQEVTVAAEEFHSQKHWHRNWQGYDAILLRVPAAVYQAGSQEPSK